MLSEPRYFTYGVDLDTRYWPFVTITPDHWHWTRPPRVKGYGGITVGGKRVLVHRFTWSMYHGPIPQGFQVDHWCHLHSCVNPDHLRCVTPKQNSENRAGSWAVSGYRHVYADDRGRWRVIVRHDWKNYHGGTYDTPEEANHAAQALRDRLYTHHTDGLVGQST